MQRVVVLGSTGSIGRQTLEIIAAKEQEYTLLGVAAHRNVSLLAAQARQFNTPLAAVYDAALAPALARTGYTGQILSGAEGVLQLAALPEADVVIQAMSGAGAVLPTIAALRAGKRLGLANKEALVAAGDIVRQAASSGGGVIIPVDSEHAAIAHCLEGKARRTVKQLWLTCSGGPFYQLSPEALRLVTPQQALQHPSWRMGAKITVDSATLMNKGLEVIEAHHLFEQSYATIRVVIHPQSIVHSMVEFKDHSVLAQMSRPDMRLPIQYALTYPERLVSLTEPLDWTALQPLTFFAPDEDKFPALTLAYAAGETGGTLPAVMNAANEEAARCFLAGKIGFTAIIPLVRRVMERHAVSYPTDVEAILEADRWARETAIAELS
jgi:1-deoxy-D-xylulose-5-phosphate reductoisomerase